MAICRFLKNSGAGGMVWLAAFIFPTNLDRALTGISLCWASFRPSARMSFIFLAGSLSSIFVESTVIPRNSITCPGGKSRDIPTGIAAPLPAPPPLSGSPPAGVCRLCSRSDEPPSGAA